MGKQKLIGFMLVIGLAWAIIMCLDWSRLFYFATTGRAEEYLLSRQIKLLLSFIVGVFVWTSGKAALTTRDRVLMGIAFAIIFCADISFYLDNSYMGIGVFLLAQIILIIRNGTGIQSFISSDRFKKLFLRLVLTMITIFIITIVIIVVIFIPHSSNSLFPLIVGYSFFLSCSLYVGIMTRTIGYFPRVNSTMIALGIVLFYIGDIMVGLNIVLPLDPTYIISTSLTWFFYLPAITLLALSGYQWPKSSSAG